MSFVFKLNFVYIKFFTNEVSLYESTIIRFAI